MKRIIVKIVLIVTLVAIAIGGILRSCSLQNELDRRNKYISQYEEQVAGKDKKYQELEMTYNQLRSSKDSLHIKLDSICKANKLKPKEVTRIEYIDRFLTVTDTILVKDPLFVRDFDTTLTYNKLTKFGFKFIAPDSFVFEPEIESQMYVMTHLQKTFVNPPSKVFFIRWFQKKRKEAVVDIVEENDMIQTKQTRFINIIK